MEADNVLIAPKLETLLVQMIIFPRESFSSLANMEPNISRERNIVVGWGTIWSMEFVCVEGEESPSDHSDLVLAVLLHRYRSFRCWN